MLKSRFYEEKLLKFEILFDVIVMFSFRFGFIFGIAICFVARGLFSWGEGLAGRRVENVRRLLLTLNNIFNVNFTFFLTIFVVLYYVFTFDVSIFTKI